MKRITVQDVLRFAKKNDGRTFFTLKQKKPFRLKIVNGSITFYPSSGTPFWPDLEKYVAVFNRRPTLTPRDYPKELWSRSYFVSLVHAMLDKGTLSADPAARLSTELREILDARPTEQLELLKSRIGQGKFRQSLIKLRRKCYVTGIADERFLRASHIKPWSDSTNQERLDPYNGLLLSPIYDHLFDRAYISFKNDGRILVSPKIPPDIIHAFNINLAFAGDDLGERTKRYLRLHRKRFNVLATD